MILGFYVNWMRAKGSFIFESSAILILEVCSVDFCAFSKQLEADSSVQSMLCHPSPSPGPVT